MAKRCMGGYTTTREVYKTVKKYDHQQFDAFCTRVYTNGFNEGKQSITEQPVRTITVEQLTTGAERKNQRGKRSEVWEHRK